MLEYRAEGLCRNANTLTPEEWERCIAAGEVLQSTALAYDTDRCLRFEIAGHRARMPFAECVDTAPGEEIKDIAVLTRVGRPTCFIVTGSQRDENGEEIYLLSRAEAQRQCKRQYLDTLEAGSVLPCTVTHIEGFGAFCDIGCGIAALLPIDCLSVSRISSPADRVRVGQQLLCAIKNRDAQGRIVLTLRELLGTWSENAACFAPGETVVGIVRSVEEYGVFIEIAPNLAGLAEADPTLTPGQTVSVYIKNILPDKMKIKLVVVNKNLGQPLRFEPHYFVTRGRIKKWIYSTPQSRKQIETVF
ncbi:S1 RNA-binding domain-containing protein [uncultured Gemmiger sp.]|uniref:S1 RNA-binding domain-containing protein n=1 Tax=uncultured Gemmiger sp. TaxID=1623490 RepID=UPI0025CC8AB7|nr:S1 RNA-binding domain-containing protein [uncultured Gemmiger sp.]